MWLGSGKYSYPSSTGSFEEVDSDGERVMSSFCVGAAQIFVRSVHKFSSPVQFSMVCLPRGEIKSPHQHLGLRLNIDSIVGAVLVLHVQKIVGIRENTKTYQSL